mmetsp:Transcript_9452/g.19997  ORF Transcript_9452/g.19997 Transcript_9452/m.19997 type:complete len:120 (-) Transcript_9452:628-987(-)
MRKSCALNAMQEDPSAISGRHSGQGVRQFVGSAKDPVRRNWGLARTSIIIHLQSRRHDVVSIVRKESLGVTSVGPSGMGVHLHVGFARMKHQKDLRSMGKQHALCWLRHQAQMQSFLQK